MSERLHFVLQILFMLRQMKSRNFTADEQLKAYWLIFFAKSNLNNEECCPAQYIDRCDPVP